MPKKLEEKIAKSLEPLADVNEAAEILGVTKERVKFFAKQGRLASVLRWGRLIFWQSEVEKFAEQDRPAGRPRELE